MNAHIACHYYLWDIDFLPYSSSEKFNDRQADFKTRPNHLRQQCCRINAINRESEGTCTDMLQLY